MPRNTLLENKLDNVINKTELAKKLYSASKEMALDYIREAKKLLDKAEQDLRKVSGWSRTRS